MKRLLQILLLIALSAACAAAQEAADPYDLPFGQNINTPKVPARAQKPIQKHMQDISATLSKHMGGVKLLRGGEVVQITIPCSTLFAPNSIELKKEAAAKYLNPYRNLLKYPTMYKVVVAVHSDESGAEDYLDWITDARANAIDQYLCEIAERQGENVIPYGIGPDEPLAPNNSIANRDKNRRVEIYIIPEAQMIERAKSGKLN